MYVVHLLSLLLKTVFHFTLSVIVFTAFALTAMVLVVSLRLFVNSFFFLANGHERTKGIFYDYSDVCQAIRTGYGRM